jgi:hypothetical protein
MQAYLVANHQIDEVWPVVQPLISAACEYNNNRYTSEDYLLELKAGIKHLWVAIDNGLQGLAIAEIIRFPRKVCCSIDMFTGDGLDQLLEFLPLIEAWAKEMGCEQMFANTRPGLSKKLKSQQYRTTHTLLEKDL